MALHKLTHFLVGFMRRESGVHRGQSIPGPTMPVRFVVTPMLVMVMVPMVVLTLMLVRVAVNHHLAMLAIHLALQTG